MAAYLKITRDLLSSFISSKVQGVLREENQHAYAIANLGYATDKATPQMISIVVAQSPMVLKETPEELAVLGEVNPVEENEDC